MQRLPDPIKKLRAPRLPIPPEKRNATWNRFFSSTMDVFKCPCCQKQKIAHCAFQVGHVAARKCGGFDTGFNFVPICGQCNKEMGTMHLLEYMRKKGLHSAHIEEKLEFEFHQHQKKLKIESPDFMETDKQIVVGFLNYTVSGVIFAYIDKMDFEKRKESLEALTKLENVNFLPNPDIVYDDTITKSSLLLEYAKSQPFIRSPFTQNDVNIVKDFCLKYKQHLAEIEKSYESFIGNSSYKRDFQNFSKFRDDFDRYCQDVRETVSVIDDLFEYFSFVERKYLFTT